MGPELELLLPELDEKARRLVLGAVARAAGDGGGHGGGQAVRGVVADGRERRGGTGIGRERAARAGPPPGRVRRPGAGRKPLSETGPGLVPALLGLVEDSSRGIRSRRFCGRPRARGTCPARWPRPGTGAARRPRGGCCGSRGSPPRPMPRSPRGRGTPDRDGQFRYIAAQAKEHLAAGQPVISVDAKKKENVCDYAQPGAEWRPRGDPVRARSHDFADPGGGHAIPYGIYDVAANTGFVNVGTDHNTAALAVESVRRWWDLIGKDAYPGAARLLVTCDADGSNGWRNRAWKAGLAQLAQDTGLQITVCHFPPGTRPAHRSGTSAYGLAATRK